MQTLGDGAQTHHLGTQRINAGLGSVGSKSVKQQTGPGRDEIVRVQTVKHGDLLLSLLQAIVLRDREAKKLLSRHIADPFAFADLHRNMACLAADNSNGSASLCA